MTCYKLKGQDVMSSMALEPAEACFKPGSLSYEMCQKETEQSRVLLGALKTIDANVHVFKDGVKN